MDLAGLTPAEVMLDGLVDTNGQQLRLQALVEAKTWNGWAVPHFEEQDTRLLVEALGQQGGCSATLDSQHRVVVVRIEDADPPEETFAAQEVGARWLYPVGAAAWCWEVAPPISAGSRPAPGA